MENSNPIKIIYFDRHGDVRLLVDDTYLVVSSKTMSLISDPWNAMLGSDGSSSEAQSWKDKIIPLPEDDLQALKILLHISHLQFHKVPQHTNFEQLLALAVLTDKYQATQLVGPWLKGWLECVSGTVGMDGYEGWLWIAWEYGLPAIFQQVADRLVLESKADDGGAYVAANGKPLTDIVPPSVIEIILDARNGVISSVLDVIHDYVDKFSNLDITPVCLYNSFECHAMTFESLVLELRRQDLWPVPEFPSEISISVEDLARQVNELQVLVNTHSRNFSCNVGQAMKDRIRTVVQERPAVLSDSHEVHMKAQYAKWSASEEVI